MIGSGSFTRATTDVDPAPARAGPNRRGSACYSHSVTVDEGKEGFPSPFGRYTLVERLATGGMAEVFKAKITSAHGFEKLLVIKRILPQLAADRNFVSMFIDEAKLTAQLIHPKIVQVIDFGEVKGQYFIALEFIDGFDALALLRGSAQKQLRLPMPICMFIAMEVLDALDYAHNAKDAEGRPMRLVHRDISPSNVFLARRGDVKLGDFGIAHAQERESKTQAGTLKGKYGYMSPEQVLGATLDGRSDLFAVGIVLAEMLMGRRLFSAPNDLDVLLMVRDGRLERLDKHARDLPASLDHIVRKALAKKVVDRYQTAGEFRDALADLLFQSGMRVSPSDIGRISTDFLDPSPAATARLGDQIRRWTLRATAPSAPLGTPDEALGGRAASGAHHLGGAPGSMPNSPSLSSGSGSISISHASGSMAAAAGSSAPSFRRSAGGAGGNTPAPVSRGSGPVVTHAPEDPLEVELEDGAAAVAAAGPGSASHAPVPSSGAHRQRPGAGSMEAKMDEVLAQPLSVVDLDTYHTPTPARAGPALRATGHNLRTPGPAAAAPTAVADLATMSPLRIVCDLACGGESGLLRVEAAGAARDLTWTHGLPRAMGINGARVPADQLRSRVIELFAVTAGRASFFRGAGSAEDGDGLDAFEAMGAGVLALPVPVLRQRFLPLLDLAPVAVSPARVEPESFCLGPTPRELWSMLDGTRTIRQWLTGFPTPDEQMTFLRTLYLLIEAGLARAP